jgi:hypothetical protein
MAGLMLFNVVEHLYTTSSSPAFTDGDTYLTPPSDFAWPTDPVVLLDSEGDLMTYAEWIPWHVFRGLNSATVTSQVPKYLSIKNEFENKIHIFPSVDAGSVGTIAVSYFRRIAKPSEARSGTTLYLPDETLEALLTGAEYFLIRHRHKDDPRIARDFYKEFLTTIMQARAAAARRDASHHGWARPDEVGHLATHPYEFAGTRPTYIKL